MDRSKLGIYLLLTCCWLAVPAWAARPIDEKMAADPEGIVEVYNISGSIRISTWQRDEVEVTGTLGNGVERLEFKREGNRILVRPKIPEHSRNVKPSKLVLKVPIHSRIQANGVSSNVEVDKGKGKGALEVDTVSGYIRISGQAAEIDAHSVSGYIEIEAKAPRVATKSVSGNLDLEIEGEEVRGETVSGWIKVAVDRLDRGDYRSVSGNIDFSGQLKKNGRLEANNHSGNIELRLHGKIDADFCLSTFSGHIANELGPDARKTGDFTPEKRLDFSTGSGSARVELKSFSGNISLRKE